MRRSLSYALPLVAVLAAAVAGEPQVCVFAQSATAAPPPPRTAPPSSPAAPAPALGPEAARKAFDEALALEQKGRIADACQAFRVAVDALPVWGLARFELGQCLRLLGEPTDSGVDALAEIEAAERDLQRPALYVEKGRLLEDRGRPVDAFAAYVRAIDMMPAEIRAWEGAARTAAVAAPARERHYLEGWLARQAHDPAAWERLARLHEREGRLADAERAWLEVAQRSADRRRGAAALGLFAARSGSRSAAEKARRLADERR
jgi:tetratricopeptide (TPR) repeat protein